MNLSVKFYSLLTSFSVDSSVNVMVDARGEARVYISTRANGRMDGNLHALVAYAKTCQK